MNKKYLVVGGYVYARDGDKHWITAKRLTELYRVDIRQCILTDSINYKTDTLGLEVGRYIHLYPSSSGNYILEKKHENLSRI